MTTVIKGRTRALDEMVAGTSKWVRDVGVLLEAFDRMLGECHLPDDAPKELHDSIEQLRPVVRQCRAQTPDADRLRTWMRDLTRDPE